MKSWTVDPELARKVREHLLGRELGDERVERFEDVSARVRELVVLLIPGPATIRGSVLDDATFSARLEAHRSEAARRAYTTLLPDTVRARVLLEDYVQRRTTVASLTSSVDSLLGFFDPVGDVVCVRSMPRGRVIEIALREELRRFFRRDLPPPYRWLPEGATEETSMEFTLAQTVLRRYYDPIVRPASTPYPRARGRTWAQVCDDDVSAVEQLAGAACRHFLETLGRHYDFTSPAHLERIDTCYREDAEALVAESLDT